MGDLTSDHAELSLSAEEVELLQLLGHGLPLEAVARRLRTSERTDGAGPGRSACGWALISRFRPWSGPRSGA